MNRDTKKTSTPTPQKKNIVTFDSLPMMTALLLYFRTRTSQVTNEGNLTILNLNKILTGWQAHLILYR